ncbi:MULTISPECIES: ATP-binding cassette domain-containing protein [unclassified Methanoregula]|uniref:ATP-binding cassette domain-containing protein n=1 Tax=unclassified Methanoregula TaxID=2649730 RepID=UPI0009D3F856|nr:MULTISPECIES: ATP-binding cassette domain-containing protein [unclassified Methanoregula]OPX62812.1 MAG: Trehalose/maltose import ATP-binding protein MalK [Methanoregula sp. PtaB.Bin085]OPY35249.1 MAG: Trehalose/maltose import ATP-binding protein MalK [Methanoregula sp. PtaU1.Bin006]
MHLIETRDLCYVYPGKVTALNNINFIAPRNARIAVIGSNGAGKSTLFKHFNGIFRPTSGQVLIRGEPITKQNVKEIRKFVGIVFQNPDDQIFAPTVEQDVAFGPTNLGLDPETIHHRVHEALKVVGIEHLAHRVPHHLSGGEKKRVAIAGVIAMEPEVLVLDEPNAGLDPRGVADLNLFINSLAKKFGMTVIFSTHDVGLVPEVADFIYVMDKGRIVASGTVDEIFIQPDMLKSVRLDVPVIPKLLKSLKENGVDVSMAYTYADAEAALLRAYGKRS